LCGAETWGTSESRTEIHSSFWYIVEGSDGEDSWTDRVKSKELLHRVKEESNILQRIKRRKDNWVGHILLRNCLLKHALEGKVE